MFIQYLNKSRLQFLTLLLISVLAFSCCETKEVQKEVEIENSSEPAYGFYDSEKGPEFKLFKHQLLGFEITIPANWIFGIVGQSQFAVAMIYPEELNTAEFSNDFETIEIGKIPSGDITLNEAYENVMLGMQQKHSIIDTILKREDYNLKNNSGIRWSYTWQSKTDFVVFEEISLIKFNDEIRSITIRTVNEPTTDKLSFYREMVESITLTEIK